MADAKFEKLTRSDAPMYGPPKLILCGFGPGAQPKFKSLLDMIGLAGVPLVWADEALAAHSLDDILEMDDACGAGRASSLPRAVIVSGISQRQLQTLMGVCRKTGMKKALWAALTPTSRTWTLTQLLDELSAERRALKKKRR